MVCNSFVTCFVVNFCDRFVCVHGGLPVVTWGCNEFRSWVVWRLSSVFKHFHGCIALGGGTLWQMDCVWQWRLGSVFKCVCLVDWWNWWKIGSLLVCLMTCERNWGQFFLGGMDIKIAQRSFADLWGGHFLQPPRVFILTRVVWFPISTRIATPINFRYRDQFPPFWTDSMKSLKLSSCITSLLFLWFGYSLWHLKIVVPKYFFSSVVIFLTFVCRIFPRFTEFLALFSTSSGT